MTAVFLDRDDTLIYANALPAPAPPANPGDVTDPALVKLLPGVRIACARLKQAGLRLIVNSNQGGIARGAIPINTAIAINDRVRALIGDGIIEAFYICPFHPKGNVPSLTREHSWRKPGPGMILAAADELSINLADAFSVGDRQRDVDSALAAGLAPDRCFLLSPDSPTPDLQAAAELILQRLAPPPATAATTQNAGATMRLTAREGSPLADPRTRATVIATASAIAERTGITLSAIHAEDTSITVTLLTDRIAGLGFLAELRRTTNAWYASRNTGQSLWGDPPTDSST